MGFVAANETGGYGPHVVSTSRFAIESLRVNKSLANRHVIGSSGSASSEIIMRKHSRYLQKFKNQHRLFLNHQDVQFTFHRCWHVKFDQCAPQSQPEYLGERQHQRATHDIFQRYPHSIQKSLSGWISYGTTRFKWGERAYIDSLL